jgi:hypothetical protein
MIQIAPEFYLLTDLFFSIHRDKSHESYRMLRPIRTTAISPACVIDHNERSEIESAFAASRAVNSFGDDAAAPP